MALFTDTVTLYQKQMETWKRTVVSGVQWLDSVDKVLDNGKLKRTKAISITFPEETLDKIDLTTYTEEDAIFFGEISEEISTEKGHRLSDLLDRYPKSGIIRSVNDNSNRDFLKNVKVVIY